MPYEIRSAFPQCLHGLSSLRGLSGLTLKCKRHFKRMVQKQEGIINVMGDNPVSVVDHVCGVKCLALRFLGGLRI